MSDIVERLKASYSLSHFLVMEAIDEIERLRAISARAQSSNIPDRYRDEMFRGLIAFFSESVHTVWDTGEISECLAGMMSEASSIPSTKQQSDPADIWDAYCEEVPADRRSPQGAMAFALSVSSTQRGDAS